MIRHVVAFRFRPEVTEDDRHATVDELNTFPSFYPAMQRWALGRNVSQRDDTFTHAFSVEFATEADLLAYLNSEQHEAFVRERFRPRVEARAIVSFEEPPSGPSWHGSLRHTGPGLSRPPVRGVIFDMDGLLVDTLLIWREVGNRLFAAHDVDISSVTEAGAVRGMSVGEAMDLLRNYAGWTADQHADLEQRVVDDVVAAIHAGAELKAGAEAALDFCEARGLVMAMASGSTRPILDAVLTRFGLVGRFAAVCSAAGEPVGKPHPAVFLRAAAEMAVPAEACLVLEDAVNGCIAAKAAGMRVIAVPDGPTVGDPRFAIADLVLASLEELPQGPALSVMGLTPG